MYVENRQFQSLPQLLDSLPDWHPAGGDEQTGCFLIQVFAALTLEEAKALAKQLKLRFPNSAVIGMSLNNGLIGGRHVETPIIVSLAHLQQSHIETSWHTVIPETCEQDGRALFSQLDAADNRAFICFAHGIDASCQQLFGQVGKLNNDVPIVGGIVDHSAEAKGPWVMVDEHCAPGIIGAVALRSHRLKVWQSAFLEWMPVGRRMVVTRAEGHRLYEVDGETIADAYARYFSINGQCQFEVCQDFPLLFRQGNQEFYTAAIKAFDDGSMEMTEAIPEGVQVQFSYFHPKLSQSRIRQKLHEIQTEAPEAVFLYNCASRIFNDDGCIEEELAVFEELAPSVGGYCFGEFAAVPSQRIAHHSVTYLSLSEKGDVVAPSPDTFVKNERVDRTLSPVFTLINQAFTDLEQLNESLEDEVAQKTSALLASAQQHPLTKLPNRGQLVTRLQQYQRLSGMAVIKLCNLGWINHGVGDKQGDQAVIWLAAQLAAHTEQVWPSAAELFQLSGSEWLLAVCTDVSEVNLLRQLEKMLRDIDVIEYPVSSLQLDTPLNFVLKAGVVAQPGGKMPVSDIKLNRMVHRAKQARREALANNKLVSLFQPHEHSTIDPVDAIAAMATVKSALSENRVVVFGHPILASGERRLASIECLVRIRLGNEYISPAQFLPAVSHSELYSQLSREVIRQSIEMLDGQAVRYSINLAPQDFFNHTTYECLLQHIRAAQTPQHIGLEILETEQIVDYAAFAERLQPLREAGARLIIDDFGSGYSNMNEILKLSPEVVKFDGSLVSDMDTNPQQRLMVEHLNNLCQSLGIQTTAEFVRNQAICELVESIGVDYLQGFYLAQPQPLDLLLSEYLSRH
ncbi:EAL domain-containing protein [Corallincola luteus]|uniref:EAL domain-containing protein n=1 Tax=Corallincola luteus TaxID=1775177 RepID=A0ABY2ALT5_9GAMM|nr:EAL domain-containing protein [Corallincola luteus]TCI02890.1 EAL domain-containing protein [Corallincola luteus]